MNVSETPVDLILNSIAIVWLSEIDNNLVNADDRRRCREILQQLIQAEQVKASKCAGFFVVIWIFVGVFISFVVIEYSRFPATAIGVYFTYNA